MRDSAQLVLDLGHRPALGREDFLVADANEAAVAWIDRWPDWPAPALVLEGPPGCGKTHLAQVWRAVSGAHYLAGDGDAAALPKDIDCCVVEAADTRRDDIALFHLFNRIAERRGHLLLTCREPPGRWRDRLPDLVSRLRAAPAAAIAAPDDALIGAVLVKHFGDRQLRVGAAVIAYLVTHMERSFAAARSVVAAADSAALTEGRNVTVPLMRDVLSGLSPPGASRPSAGK